MIAIQALGIIDPGGNDREEVECSPTTVDGRVSGVSILCQSEGVQRRLIKVLDVGVCHVVR